jgi:branched-chain amino acid transport system ATP-binding protein
MSAASQPQQPPSAKAQEQPETGAQAIRTKHPTRSAADQNSGEVLLAVRGLRVQYGGIVALRGIDLEVRRGEVVALIGANGAGKTTTLKSIAGLIPVAQGSVEFNGQSVVGQSPEALVARGISMAPEGRAIFPALTVRENLELGAYLHRDPQTMKETLEDVVRLFPRLGERMKQEGGTLSGGEQQMLAIGRALMARPALLLLDEPSLGIAPKLVQQIFVAIRSIAEAGVTILVVEQNTKVALSNSSRGYVLRTGEIALSGLSQDLLQNAEIKKAYLGG